MTALDPRVMANNNTMWGSQWGISNFGALDTHFFLMPSRPADFFIVVIFPARKKTYNTCAVMATILFGMQYKNPSNATEC